MKKTVLMPIKVPATDYCWDGKNCCEHFDNEGGHGACDLGIHYVNRDKHGYYPKPQRCSQFKEGD